MNFLPRTMTKSFTLAISFAMVVIFGLLDYHIEPQLIIPYLLPVSLAAWFAGMKWGAILSVASVSTWVTSKILSGEYHPSPTVLYWDIVVRPFFFIIISYTLSALRTAQKEREELTQFIVHDLRSPLTNMMIGLNTLREAVGKISEPRKQYILNTCISSCGRMSMLVTSLLDTAALEDGKMEIHKARLNAREVVSESIKEVSLWAELVDLTIRNDSGDNIPELFTDRVLLVRVLVNLLSNAVKASPPGSVVTVVAMRQDPNSVVFRVEDQGHGIRTNRLKTVFKKFVSSENEGSVRNSDTGIGLTFCRRAVEAIGGTIGIESEPGRGTTVSFTLPEYQS